MFFPFMNDNEKIILPRFFREPLVHFLVLGAALFFLYANINKDTTERTDRVVIDEPQILRLAEQFQRTWMRPPTRQELEGLIEDLVLEEILYREALALGLDQDDLVIRRRLRQKMEFLNADLVEQQPATDAELQAYLDVHPDKFRQPERLSFLQVYLKSGDSAEESGKRAAHVRNELGARAPANVDFQAFGDPTLLPDRIQAATVDEINRTFGGMLSEEITRGPEAQWSGPFTSGYGLHLIYVTERIPASEPTLAEVRSVVEREWAAERRKEANRWFYQVLRDRYTVDIEMPVSKSIDVQAAARP
jgi:hypothetical protein